MNIQQIKRGPSALQQPIDVQDLRLKLHRELAGEQVESVTELDSGLFNNTYRVDTEKQAYILKVAPGEEADVFYNERSLMQRERALAPRLQSLSALIPEYLSFFDVGGRNAFLQPFVEGRLWHDEITSLSETENSILWRQLGEFSRQLHGCSGERFGYPHPSQNFSRWSTFIANNVTGMVDDCQRLNVSCDEVEHYCRLLPCFYSVLDDVKTPQLIHGDLWPRNVIIDGVGNSIHIKAVFDAERAFWGDPISDWVLILYGVPESFWQGYGENLIKTSDLRRVNVYKGMYFILNILECTRFNESDVQPRQWLSDTNDVLEELL